MKKVLLIFVGGAAGAILRYGVKGIDLNVLPQVFPINTLIVNVLGCFLIGGILTFAYEYGEMDPELRIGIATGFIGALTTFSTFCKEIVLLLEGGNSHLALIYGVVSLLFGYLAIIGGVTMVRATFERRRGDTR